MSLFAPVSPAFALPSPDRSSSTRRARRGWTGLLRTAALWAGLCGAAGCGGEVVVLQVEPQRVPTGAATEVTIYGDGFEWDYSPVINAVSGSFEVFADDVALEAVTWLDPTRLRATVPADMAPGLYSIRVSMDHRQEDAVLDDALVVTAP